MNRLYSTIVLIMIAVSSISAQSIFRGKTLKTSTKMMDLEYVIDQNGNASMIMTARIGGYNCKAKLNATDHSSAQFFYQDIDLNSLELLEMGSDDFVFTKEYATINGQKVDKAAFNKKSGNGAWERQILPMFTQTERQLAREMSGGLLSSFKSQIVYMDEKCFKVASGVTVNEYTIQTYEIIQ